MAHGKKSITQSLISAKASHGSDLRPLQGDRFQPPDSRISVPHDIPCRTAWRCCSSNHPSLLRTVWNLPAGTMQTTIL